LSVKLTEKWQRLFYCCLNDIMFCMRIQMTGFLYRMKLLAIFMVNAGLLLTACTAGNPPATIEATQAPDSSVTDLAPGTAETSSSEAAQESRTEPTATTPVRPTRKPASTYADLEIVTLLPRDAIPAIDNPQFLPAEEADEFYDADELVMGVSFNGDTRAYSAPFLSNHEIVNDTVGGVKIAVTW
jgi:hypothetical protein